MCIRDRLRPIGAARVYIIQSLFVTQKQPPLPISLSRIAKENWWKHTNRWIPCNQKEHKNDRWEKNGFWCVFRSPRPVDRFSTLSSNTWAISFPRSRLLLNNRHSYRRVWFYSDWSHKAETTGKPNYWGSINQDRLIKMSTVHLLTSNEHLQIQ